MDLTYDTFGSAALVEAINVVLNIRIVGSSLGTMVLCKHHCFELLNRQGNQIGRNFAKWMIFNFG
jgi:hypothetical protein